MSNSTAIGQRIKTVRRQRGMQQTELAAKVGFSQTQISKLENDISLGTKFLLPLANALGVDPKWLATGAGSPNSKKESLSEDEFELLSYYRKMGVRKKKQLISSLAS